MTHPSFALDPRLDADTATLGDLPLCRVLLMDEATYPWLVLVPRRPDAVELTDLDEADRLVLMDEIAATSVALRTASGLAKLNVAAIGNVVAQLHVHLVARLPGDPAWPKPVWGLAPPVRREPAERDRIAGQLRGLLWPSP